MPARARTLTDREQDRVKAAKLLTSLRNDIDALEAAIAALPAPADRSAAQRRDALIMRTLIKVIRWDIIACGAGTEADRADEPA